MSEPIRQNSERDAFLSVHELYAMLYLEPLPVLKGTFDSYEVSSEGP